MAARKTRKSERASLRRSSKRPGLKPTTDKEAAKIRGDLNKSIEKITGAQMTFKEAAKFLTDGGNTRNLPRKDARQQNKRRNKGKGPSTKLRRSGTTKK